MAREKKRICLALSNVAAEDVIIQIIKNKFSAYYEIAENVRSKEALISAINREKFDAIILREDLTGDIDLIDLLKAIRTSNNDIQIIFFMNNRENGDPFYVELFLFNVYDFVVLPDIKLDDIFEFLNRPRKFKDIIRFLPVRAERIRNLIVEANTDMKAPPKLNEEGDVDEVFTVNVNDRKPRNNPNPRPTQNNYPGYNSNPTQKEQPITQPTIPTAPAQPQYIPPVQEPVVVEQTPVTVAPTIVEPIQSPAPAPVQPQTSGGKITINTSVAAEEDDA